MEDHIENKLILGYWDLRGIAAPIRYLLEYLEVPYSDLYHVYGEAPHYSKDKWLSLKNQLGLDFPNLPYLIDGEFKITESQAIIRYICNKHCPKLLGESLKDKAMVDMTMYYL